MQLLKGKINPVCLGVLKDTIFLGVYTCKQQPIPQQSLWIFAHTNLHLAQKTDNNHSNSTTPPSLHPNQPPPPLK